MAFNGSGVYVLPAADTPAVPNTLIESTKYNNVNTDLATALSTCITKDGQTTDTNNIPLNGNKLTGVGAATARTDAATLANVQDGTGVYVATVGGTADVITLAPSPAITAYAAGQTFRFIASGANTTNVTVAVSGLAAKAITKNGSTALVASDIPSGSMVDITYDGTRFILGTLGAATYTAPFADSTALVKGSSDDTKLVRIEADGLTTGTTRVLSIQDKNITVAGLDDITQIQDIDASVSSNALTITINPTTLDFRSTTLTDGTPTTVNLASAVTVVVPDTATLGTVNATAARLAVLAINNAGTIEAAVVNLAGGNNLDETTLISTTAISTGADSNNVIYSTTARSNVAFRVVGFIDITETTAGTWATAPTKVQGTGGQALAALSSLGFGQTWQSVTRNASTTYYNTTGRPIVFSGSMNVSTSFQLTVNGVALNTTSTSSSVGAHVDYVIPAWASYSYSGGALLAVFELR